LALEALALAITLQATTELVRLLTQLQQRVVVVVAAHLRAARLEIAGVLVAAVNQAAIAPMAAQAILHPHLQAKETTVVALLLLVVVILLAAVAARVQLAVLLPQIHLLVVRAALALQLA
jgi:hypothetical protein